MTRVFHLEEPQKGHFILRIAFYARNEYLGVIEVFYTAGDIHHIEYCNRFIGATLLPVQLGYELSRAITCVTRLRSGGSVEDLNNGSDEIWDQTRFDLQEDF